MKIAPIADVKAKFSEFVKATEKGPVVVTRNGHPVVLMVGIESASDDDLERILLSHSPTFQDILRRSRDEVRETGGVSHRQFWNDVDDE